MTKIKTIGDLKPNPQNANAGSIRGHSIIEQSVRARGAGRSGLAASDGTMIAGDQTLQKMAELGIPIRPIHTDGKEWVVVIRDDIEPGSEAAVLLGLEDNRAAEVGITMIPGVLAGIADAGVDLSGLYYPDEWQHMLGVIEAAPSLDSLGEHYGENGERDFWPMIKAQVSPEMYQKYKELLSMVGGGDETEQMHEIISRCYDTFTNE